MSLPKIWFSELLGFQIVNKSVDLYKMMYKNIISLTHQHQKKVKSETFLFILNEDII